MSIAKKIAEQVESISHGSLFTYKQLVLRPNEYGAASKTLERLVKKDIIQRSSPGLFYKPKKKLAKAVPKKDAILKHILFHGDNRIAYVTGFSLYNKLGLTRRTTLDIKIASREKRIRTRIYDVMITPSKSYVDVNNQNYRLLEILDALKDFKKIVAKNHRTVIKKIMMLIGELDKNGIQKLIQIAFKYPPRVIALLGALLDNIDGSGSFGVLKKRISPLSTYSYGIKKEILPTGKRWNIV